MGMGGGGRKPGPVVRWSGSMKGHILGGRQQQRRSNQLYLDVRARHMTHLLKCVATQQTTHHRMQAQCNTRLSQRYVALLPRTSTPSIHDINLLHSSCTPSRQKPPSRLLRDTPNASPPGRPSRHLRTRSETASAWVQRRSVDEGPRGKKSGMSRWREREREEGRLRAVGHDVWRETENDQETDKLITNRKSEVESHYQASRRCGRSVPADG